MKFTSRLLGVAAVLVVIMFATNGYAHHAQYYVLDGFGGVHAGGGAPVPPTTPGGIPYFGFDIAKGIAFVPSDGPGGGDGVIVLDGFGGIHTAGLPLPVVPKTPYFGFDIARAITYRNIPPRLGATVTNISNTTLASATYIAVESTSITAPDDGSVLAICNMAIFCGSCTDANPGDGWLAIGIDSLTATGSIERQVYYETTSSQVPTWSQTISVTAGAHTISCLARDGGFATNLTYYDPTVSALFVDHNFMGTSNPEVNATGPTGIGQ